MLTACISGTKPPETITSPSGKETIIQSDHEKCVSACNETYSRCMDAEPAENNTGIVGGRSAGVIGPTGMFGASADCRNDLQSCLPGCNAR